MSSEPASPAQEPALKPEELDRLEARYTADQVPPCPVCGRKLRVQRAGGGEPTLWACDGLETDPDNPERLRRAPGWTEADQHYERSRFVQYRQGDDDVLRLIAQARPVPPAAAPVGELREGPLLAGLNREQVVAELRLASEWHDYQASLAEVAGLDDAAWDHSITEFSAMAAALAAAPVAGDRETAGVDMFDYSRTRVITRRDPVEHELKTWTVPFRAVKSGEKTFEFRKNDRDFRDGDILWLRETEAGGGSYTGEELRFRAGFVLRGGMFGVPLGYCVMSLLPATPPSGGGDHAGGGAGKTVCAVQRGIDCPGYQVGFREGKTYAQNGNRCEPDARATAAPASGVLSEGEIAHIKTQLAHEGKPGAAHPHIRFGTLSTLWNTYLAASPKAQGSDVGLREALERICAMTAESVAATLVGIHSIAAGALAASRTGQTGAGE